MLVIQAKKEGKAIKNRFVKKSSKNELVDLLKQTPPSQLAGFKDTWDFIIPLSAEGVSLQLKKFCTKLNKKCVKEYLECRSICDKVIQGLLDFLQQNLFQYVKEQGLDTEGEYPFFKLIKFNKNKNFYNQ